MNDILSALPRPTIGFCALFLGAAGFAAGFFGPMLLVPEANQGPMLGIFITGPGGAVLGLALGILLHVAGAENVTRWRTLLSVAALGVGTTLFLCLPEPARQGTLIEAETRACLPPAALADKALAHWEKRIAAVTWAAPYPGWQETSRNFLENDPGAVAEMTVLRRRDILMNRKPWNNGTFTAKAWTQGPEQATHYAPASMDCTPGRRAQYFLPYDMSALEEGPSSWPTKHPATFLSLRTLTPVPPEYAKFTR